MAEITTTTTNTSIHDLELRAEALECTANVFSRSGLFGYAAKNYHKAADIYTELGNRKKSSDCRCMWLLSEIEAA